ncbi:ATP-binding protein [Reichenbachiella carrageenanivorans]|uniref:histidine kinase n=1 Tax=Reichenbachiella carrageenanivorans TaxID=2979869 RepID=A0ABY6D4T8_9BACT|nr:hybrid sensor histidine kinase/response regulator [Reichenbachiella carrageenanivorans]UXX80824.1 ATP-binding protein [Reichenbachiella carrageenanivorans]
MRSVKSCLSLLIVFLGTVAYGATPKAIDLRDFLKDSTELTSHLRVLTDPTGSLTIGEILDSAPQFGPVPEQLSKDNVYWGKLDVENNLDIIKLYLLYVGKNDFIDCYFVQNDTIVQHEQSGYMYPQYLKSVPKGSYFIPILMNAHASQQLYIRIQDEIHNDPEFDLRISSGTDWVYNILDKHILDFIFQGLFWIILIYNLFLYGSTRAKAYLYYSFYLFCLAVNYLFLTDILREYILSDMPWNTIYFISTPMLTLVSYWVFVNEFINVKKQFSIYYLWIKRLIWLDGAMFVISLVVIHFTREIYLVTDTLRVIALANAFLVIGLSISIHGSKYEMVKYFIYGTAITVIAAVIDLALWDPSTSQASLMKYGLLIEIVVFSLGLAQRKKIGEKEKRKALNKQIDQLRVNESLAQWQKEELEKIIDHRTQKIKKKNKKLKRAIKKAESAARVKSDFLSVMSHEIRTPMNAVIGTIHLLLDENPKKAQLEHLKTLKFSSENLLILINDILDYSKVESGNVILEHIDFHLRELTKGLGNTFEKKAEESGVKFSILIDHNIPSMLKGDPARLTQILNNLISNAIKFTPSGEVKLLIHLLAKSNGRVKLEFVVEDTGIGISKDKLKLIFESFTQAHADTTRKYGGTGLGLAITKKLIKLFDSQILVKSKVNKGSKFYFSLYMEEVAHANSAIEKDDALMKEGVKGKRVLVVDDNEINLMMAKKFLDKWGMISEVVTSGKEALIRVFDTDYDLILMDLQMPEMDGYEVTATIRSLDNDGLKNIPIVAVSADTYENVKTKLDEVGMNDFLSKPFNPMELLTMVHAYTHLDQSKIQSEQ